MSTLSLGKFKGRLKDLVRDDVNGAAWGFALDLLWFAFGIQDFAFVGLSLRDSCFLRAEGTRGVCDKEATLLSEACLRRPRCSACSGQPRAPEPGWTPGRGASEERQHRASPVWSSKGPLAL